MRFYPVWIAVCLGLAASEVSAQDPPTIHIDGTVPEGSETHFFVEFDVPEGIAEVEVQHENLTPQNVLDWGLDDPNGFRGWGGGKGQPAIVGLRAALPSYVPGPIPAGTWEVVIGKASIVETPARYAIDIILRTEPTLEPQPRAPYEDPGALDSEARWYAGDFHAHSLQSDGQPTMREALEFAESVGLDFLMLAEHNTNSGITLYRSVQSDFPKLLMMPGVEWTTYSGHANAIGAVDWVDQKVGVRGMTVEDAVQAYQDQGALFSIDHPVVPGGRLCIGCPWEHEVDPTTVDGVEVQSGIWNAVDYWEQLCADGSHATAIGGSDDHRAGDGDGVLLFSPIGTPTTMVYAEELSVDAILEGIRSGRTVVKVNGIDDPMLETELTGERIGDTVFADTATLSVVVTDGVGSALQVIKDGVVVETAPITSDPFIHEMNVEAPAEGEDRYRHQVAIGADAQSIGSYVWLRPADALPPSGDSTGCGCHVASASDYNTGFLLAVFVFGAWYWRRRRVR